MSEIAQESELEAAEEAAFKAAFESDEEIDAPPETTEEAPTDDADKESVSESNKSEEAAESEPVDETTDKDEAKSKEEKEPPPEEETFEKKMETRLRRIEGRYGEMNRNVQNINTNIQDLASAQKAAAQQVRSDGSDAPTASQIKDGMSSTEKYAALKDQFPEWADAMDEGFNNIQSDVLKKTSENTYTRSDVDTIVNNSMASARTLGRIDAAHSGWEDDVKSPEFTQWKLSQPEEIQALGASSDAADAIEMLDLYKVHRKSQVTQISDQRKQKRLEDGLTPTKGGSRVREVPKTEQEEFEAEFYGKS